MKAVDEVGSQVRDPWLTEQEAARQLRVSISTIRNERNRGRLGLARVGKRVLIPMSALDAYKQAAITISCPTTNSPNSIGRLAGTSHGPTVDAHGALRRARQIASRHNGS
ncbi:helix-turn-helix domain-containing protein [Reyranella sp.]|uniref:helix-turn-helix domain-containing protein n=1 Tax=Reyranella sp. TaxID=1929291 RepID=UPI003D0C8925